MIAMLLSFSLVSSTKSDEEGVLPSNTSVGLCKGRACLALRAHTPGEVADLVVLNRVLHTAISLKGLTP